MQRVGFPFYFAAMIVMVVGLGGCGSSSSTGGKGPGGGSKGNKDDLAALGVAYHAHHDMKGQGPDSADDLINMLTDPAKRQDFASSEACKKLKSGEFVLNPRIQFREVKNLGNVAIIYEKKAPTDGGFVVLGDATTKELTAAEFKQLDSGDDARAKKK
ncbi:MAG: hypothetical protein K1X57_11650 [Gemmataceae bacterium]|nr:hypothetical protein [Gemmataceae bacterium]